MKHHFECKTFSGNPGIAPLVFDWDDETGEVSGPSAEEILAEFKEGRVPVHPIPSSHDLTSTKNKTDMAAVVGWHYHLPPELAAYYPVIKDPWEGIEIPAGVVF